MYNAQQSNFQDGSAGAAWFRNTATEPDRIYAWQGIDFYEAFKRLLADRARNIEGANVSQGSAIALQDLAALRSWISASQENWVRNGNMPQSVIDSMQNAISNAMQANRMTTGAMTVILWFLTAGSENLRFEEILVPDTAVFPPLGTAPNASPSGLDQMIFWNSNEEPPASVRGSGSSGGNRQQSSGVSGWVIALAVSVPVILGLIAFFWMRSQKQRPALGSGREGPRYGKLYKKNSKE